ncbi:MAG: hypothetical protein WC552_04360 [Candidatus Omnitrophota bacterium]
MHRLRIVIGLFFIMVLFSPRPVDAGWEEDFKQQTDELESRIRDLEDYVKNMNSSLIDFSTSIQNSFSDYKLGIQRSLEAYSYDLQTSINQKVRELDDEVVVLNLTSKGYRKVETNSGAFLVSVNNVRPIQDGYRIAFHVGNPNFASYQGIKLKLCWGKKWDPDSAQSYEEWRKTLVSAEYFYNGKLREGTWTEINIDISPVVTKQLEHIECSLDVDSIQLNLKKPDSTFE